MNTSAEIQPVDYLILGHITRDITPDGPRLGGTAAFSALLAKRLGVEVGLVTSTGPGLNLNPLSGIPMVNVPARQSTTFENRYILSGRMQIIHQLAEPLKYDHIPRPWRSARLVHLAPVAGEINPWLIDRFPASSLGCTLQGWLRQWDSSGSIRAKPLPASFSSAPPGSAAVLSREDIGGEEQDIDRLIPLFAHLVVTKGKAGADIYAGGKILPVDTTPQEETDPTGAGDIFAAAFFISLFLEGTPLLDAAQRATSLAAKSVRRVGIAGVPNTMELVNMHEVQ